MLPTARPIVTSVGPSVVGPEGPLSTVVANDGVSDISSGPGGGGGGVGVTAEGVPNAVMKAATSA